MTSKLSIFMPVVMNLFGFYNIAAANSYDPEKLVLNPSHAPTPPVSNGTSENPIARRYFALNKLQDVIKEITTTSSVPYVWGGNSLGTPETCAACSECILRKKLGPKSRAIMCPSCSKCGIDCSHLVHQIFSAAGLEFPYAASREFVRSSALSLLRNYQLVDLGKDFEQAKPGDIIVYRHHVGILMANNGNGRGDLVHASRFALGGARRIGGIRFDSNRNIVRPRGGLVRILRHIRLMLPDAERFS